MNDEIESNKQNLQVINKICNFIKCENKQIKSDNLKDCIKELCIIKLCKVIGLSFCNFKSDFFNFFASIMGQAICDKLNIKLIVAQDELRLFKYNHINLVEKTKQYLDNDLIEEAFLDAFNLVDEFKYLIKDLKKSS